MTENFINAVFNTVTVRGLKNRRRILHITDHHLISVGEDEAEHMSKRRLEKIAEQSKSFLGGSRLLPPETLAELMRYAEEISADLVLMTGDMMTFPSEENISILKRTPEGSSIPCAYIVGNHDWSFVDDDLSTYAFLTYYPRLMELSGGKDGFAMREFDDFILALVDDAMDFVHPNAASEYYRTADFARAAGKPLILGMHIPLEAENATAKCVAVAGYDLCLGPNALGSYDPVTVGFYEAVAKSERYRPDVIFTGHMHFFAEDVLPNGAVQLVTDKSTYGSCRVADLIPEE